MVKIHSGEIVSAKDMNGNTVFHAYSDLEPETDNTPFNLFSTASWYLSIIKDRHDAKNFRLGLTT